MLQLPLRNPEWRLKTGERNFGTNRSRVLSFVLFEERNWLENQKQLPACKNNRRRVIPQWDRDSQSKRSCSGRLLLPV